MIIHIELIKLYLFLGNKVFFSEIGWAIKIIKYC